MQDRCKIDAQFIIPLHGPAGIARPPGFAPDGPVKEKL
jgi:hypothetical protein